MHSGGKLNSTVFRGDEWKREGERGIKKEVWKLGTKHGWKVELADVTYIYSNASSFTIEGNKRDRRIEGRKGKILETLKKTKYWKVDERNVSPTKTEKTKQERVWKFCHGIGRYLYIFIEPRRYLQCTVGGQVKQRETGNVPPMRHVAEIYNAPVAVSTTPRHLWLVHPTRADIEHVCRYGRGKLTYYYAPHSFQPLLSPYTCTRSEIIPIRRIYHR